MRIPHFDPLEPGTYYIDPDGDPSTPLRVVYRIAADGWSQWIGAGKSAKDGHVAVSITTVTNLVRHGCRDLSPADPPVGPTVEDLATALADLAPFRVTSPPTDITMYGYRGKHLELTVPKIDFTDCQEGVIRSWIAPNLSYAFYGYSRPRHIEELWILDVEGNRLVIQANWSPGSPPENMAEMRAILDSIRIEP
jgi:hypothetical protein